MIKIALSILLSPFIIAVLSETSGVFLEMVLKTRITLPFSLGLLAYLPFHRRMSSDTRIYVLAHELSHALAALLNGVRVRKIRIRKRSGYVALDKTNAFIILSPYFVPFYVLVLGAVFFLAGFFADLSEYAFLFVFLAGFFTSFHIANTLQIIFSGPLQSDIKQAGGALFSIPMITLLNCAALLLTMKIIYPGFIAIGDFWRGSLDSTWKIYGFIFKAGIYLYNTAKIYLG